MILALDIGNTHIVVGGFEGDALCFEARLRTEPGKTSDEYGIDLKIILDMNHIPVSAVEGAIIASVVPHALNNLRSAVYKLTGKTPMVIGPGLKTGLNIKLENPAQTGADLVAAAVAALRQYQPPMVIIDMATATTMTVLDASGALVGGCICPGLNLSLNALTEHASLLPAVQLDAPRQAIGKNTTDCIRSGLMLGTASMLDGMVGRFEEEMGVSLRVIATGSIAKYVIPLCRREILLDGELVLKGLAILYRENRKMSKNKDTGRNSGNPVKGGSL